MYNEIRIEGKIEMKLLLMLIVVAMLMTGTVDAQFKSQVANQQSPSQSLIHPTTSISSFLGLLNPENFMMRHNFSLSYLSSGGQGLSLASYTNSMFYKISDPLNVRFDITLMGSPFGQYGSARQSDLSKLYLSRAEMNYRPWENFSIQLQYRRSPLYFYGLSSPYYPYTSSPLYGDE